MEVHSLLPLLVDDFSTLIMILLYDLIIDKSQAVCLTRFDQ